MTHQQFQHCRLHVTLINRMGEPDVRTKYGVAQNSQDAEFTTLLHYLAGDISTGFLWKH